MYDGDDPKFVERVRAALGDTVNPHYFASVLNTDGPGLLEWLHRESGKMANLTAQAHAWETGWKEQGSPQLARDLMVKRLGLTLMESSARSMLFVLAELSASLEALHAPVESETKELP